LRTRGIANCSAPVVVTNAEQRFLAADQLADIAVAPHALLLEPAGRNTAPAVAAAALQVMREDPAALLLVQPSDHLIGDVAAFHAAVAEAVAIADQGYLVTFGVPPTGPASGYGYIEAGERIAGSAFRILRFVEKPSLEKARSFLAQGGFYWNSGMFVFQARRYVEELGRLQPAILGAVRKALDKASADLAFLRLDQDAFSASPANSVDYAVMERTDAGAMVRASMRWSDVGSWSALWDAGEKDGAGNVSRGDVALRDASDCYVHAGSRHRRRSVATSGLQQQRARHNRDVCKLVGGQKTLLGVGDHQGRTAVRNASRAQRSVLKQRLVRYEGQELLGQQPARHRPQAAAGAAAQDYRNY